MYIKRTIEKALREPTSFSGSVSYRTASGRQDNGFAKLRNPASDLCVTRYTGKQRVGENDPTLFLQRYPAPVLIDEIQYAPELFPYIKASVDKEKRAACIG